jgi:hypothetical protein
MRTTIILWGIKIAFFGLILWLGLIVTPDFGFTIDEPISYNNGLVSEKYVYQHFAPTKHRALMQQDSNYANTTDILRYDDNDYGVVFDLPVQFGIRFFGINDSQSKYIFKHRCGFALFWLSALFFFAIVRLRFKHSEGWVFVATLLYILHPRILPDAFYNPKDVPLLSFFVISLYFQIQYLRSPTWQRALFFAIFSALTIDVRILGIMLPATTALLITLQTLQKNGASLRFFQQIPHSFWGYIAITILGIVAFMPILWHRPLYWFDIFAHMSHFRWNRTVLFGGSAIPATELPVTYLPKWIFISSPLGYSMAGFVGIISILSFIFKNITQRKQVFTTESNWIDTLFLLHFILPLVMIVLGRSVVYDGWRQVYFIYGAGVFLSLVGLQHIAVWLSRNAFKHYQSQIKNISFVFLLLTITANSAYYTYTYYPYSNIYFNITATDTPHRYELDYWGTGNLEALQYILAKDTAAHITISGTSDWIHGTTDMLCADESRRFTKDWDSLFKSQYYITQHRFAKYDTPPNSTYTEFYAIKRNNIKLTTVYKKKDK